METSFEDCVTKNSLETLVNICNCIPYNLKNYSIADEKVKYSDTMTIINYKLITQITNAGTTLCSSDKDFKCVAKTRLQYNKCLRPCEGLYVDVKKSPVEVVQVAQYKLLMKDYANHTWFHENNILEMEDMQGNLSSETFKLQLNLFRITTQISPEVCENLL